MGDPPESLVAAFEPLVVRFKEVVESEGLSGLDLLRALRTALADLYAMGLKMPPRTPRTGPGPHFDLYPNDRLTAVHDDLERRLPSDMYWSGLLPLTYETVGDIGTRRIAEDLSDIYVEFMNGFQIEATGGEAADLLNWWTGDWQHSWGITTARLLAILHEVVTDLETHIYG